MMTALAVCNNVTPVHQSAVPEMDKEFSPKAKETSPKARKSFGIRGSLSRTEPEPLLQASSPDEIALVKFSYSMRMQLKERERLSCTIRNAAGINETYKVLAMFPFTSE
jgi:phospholipid-translocating ATPase